MHEHAGFSTPGTRDNQNIAVGRGDGFSLCFVEVLKYVCNVHFFSRLSLTPANRTTDRSLRVVHQRLEKSREYPVLSAVIGVKSIILQ